MTAAVYPGSFDPVTLGHLDIVTRAAEIFDPLFVVVAENSAKTPFFSLEERLALLRETIPGGRIRVDSFRGPLVAWLSGHGLKTVVRGIRSASDFDHEYRMAAANRIMTPGIETVLLLAGERYFACSSGLVRELAEIGADLAPFVPPAVARAMRRKIAAGRDKQARKSPGTENGG